MAKPKYLTKSRFKLALECPTKLFYAGKKYEYADNSLSDEFLIALAKGGYQVGELAKCYYPGGIEVETLDPDEALRLTKSHLQKEDVILYEPAFQFQNLFIRVDVLVKKGKLIRSIEVKAKSYLNSDEFLTARGQIPADWKKYHYDVAFQKYVLSKAHPEWTINGCLLLANKNKQASIEGLFQRFLVREGHNKRMRVHSKDLEELGEHVLTEENVDHIIEKIWNGKEKIGYEEMSFEDYVHKLANHFEKDQKIEVGVSNACKDCQFKLKQVEENGLKSGFHECWTSMTPLRSEDLNKPLVIDIWDYKKTNSTLNESIFLQEEVDPETMGKVSGQHVKSGLQRVERQQIQVIKSRESDPSIYIDKEGLRHEMANVKYPLHMIDFETTMVAIPFNSGRRPYEQNAFQYSHHIIEADSTVKHQSQWVNGVPGQFPNYEFVRNLKDSLSQDEGSVFRYHYHENNVLNQIHRQIEVSDEPDREDLLRFIETITYKTEGAGKKKVTLWKGERNMIDLWDWVLRFYYDPITNGSNSLKAILPSILIHSEHLKEKYSQPIYGNEIPSLNFQDKVWIDFEDGVPISPYKLLPKLWEKYDRDELDLLINPTNELEDGGAAMTAYNYMQFPEMSDAERSTTIDSLLRYCELDTLAMVMLWEGFKDLIEN